jgi:RHS repeat-associated protein
MGNRLLAEYQPSPSKLYYYISDQVNSTRLITDSSGNTVYSAAYAPFGQMQKVWVNTYDPKLKFSGKERENASYSDVDYFGARYHANQYYRFLSPDPMINKDGAMANPQLWNLYSFARNNPITYSDLNGLWSATDWKTFVVIGWIKNYQEDKAYASAISSAATEVNQSKAKVEAEALDSMIIGTDPKVATKDIIGCGFYEGITDESGEIQMPPWMVKQGLTSHTYKKEPAYMSDTIYISRGTIELAYLLGPQSKAFEDAMATMLHETAHFVDWLDNSRKEVAEVGFQTQINIYGYVQKPFTCGGTD